MDSIFTLAILFFVISAVVRLFKRMGQQAKKAQEQAQTQAGAAQSRPAVRPAPKREDFRFPSPKKMPPAPVFQEGGDPSAIMHEYTPIKPSMDLQKQFSDYQGSLDTASTEGAGYQAEVYEPAAVPYRSDAGGGMRVLPAAFGRNTLLQAVVMSEILKRPRATR